MSSRRSIYWYTPIVRRLAVLAGIVVAVAVLGFADVLGNWSIALLAALMWAVWFAFIRKERVRG